MKKAVSLSDLLLDVCASPSALEHSCVFERAGWAAALSGVMFGQCLEAKLAGVSTQKRHDGSVPTGPRLTAMMWNARLTGLNTKTPETLRSSVAPAHVDLCSSTIHKSIWVSFCLLQHASVLPSFLSVLFLALFPPSLPIYSHELAQQRKTKMLTGQSNEELHNEPRTTFTVMDLCNF